MAYHPTNMTISLLPVISEDGRGLRWDHQAASTSLVMGVDQVRTKPSSAALCSFLRLRSHELPWGRDEAPQRGIGFFLWKPARFAFSLAGITR